MVKPLTIIDTNSDTGDVEIILTRGDVVYMNNFDLTSYRATLHILLTRTMARGCTVTEEYDQMKGEWRWKWKA